MRESGAIETIDKLYYVFFFFFVFGFFFNDTATTEIYTLSLHDALPICYITIDADKIAQSQGSVKAANIVVLGAASPFIGLKYSSLEDAVRQLFSKKSEDLVQLNLKALKAGRDFTEKNRRD